MKIDKTSIGERIKMLRQAKNLTQEELATRAGLTKGFISQIERSYTSLSVESLIGILDALDEKPSTFFDGAFDEQRWSRSFRQPPTVFKWFAAQVSHTAFFILGRVLQ